MGDLRFWKRIGSAIDYGTTESTYKLALEDLAIRSITGISLRFLICEIFEFRR